MAGKRNFNINSLERKLGLLPLFANSQKALSAVQIARFSRLPVSTRYLFLMNRGPRFWKAAAVACLLLVLCVDLMAAQTRSTDTSERACRIDPIDFEGWKAEQLSNEWLKLIVVPQLGGRLMQVFFAGHPYLFVNSEYKGHYFPPSAGAAKGKWFNYGGDKIWPMPEGSGDEHHWPGPISDELDDGEYTFQVLSLDSRCGLRLDGPPDARTGLQYSREISIGRDSPEIAFHAVMKNASTRSIQWSMQSVTQYDTADLQSIGAYNKDFWAFTPVNPQSAYLDGYHVRSGLADDPSFSVRNDLFTLHWLYLQSEVWIDSPRGWLAVADGSKHFALIERFLFHEGADYPGKATVIFYKNGPAVDIDSQGVPFIRTSPDDAPYYMEAELNSPIVRLEPGGSYAMDTKWYPTRMGESVATVTDAGAISEPLIVFPTKDGLRISASFGVFFAGKLAAHLYDGNDRELNVVALQTVNPSEFVRLNQEIKIPPRTEHVSLRLVDAQGIDRGSLGEAQLGHAPGGA
jgi:hypothetical protein